MRKIFRVIVVFYKKVLIKINDFFRKNNQVFLYYIFNKDFLFEKFEVFSGIKKYRESKANIYLLRRNIHRLEKAFSMRELKSVFAEKYISETINHYTACVNEKMDPPTLEWAYKVLVKYFELINENNSENQNVIINEIIKPIQKPGSDVQFTSGLNEVLSKNKELNFLYNLSKSRKSVRLYEKKKVPRKLISYAVKNATFAPTACNRQPLYYKVIDDPDLVKSVSEIIPGLSSFKTEADIIVLLIGDYAAYEFEQDRHLIYIDGGLSAMLFLLGLEALGLKSCVLNWPFLKKNEDELRKIVKLKITEQCVIGFTVGYSDFPKVDTESVRKNIFEYIRYNND